MSIFEVFKFDFKEFVTSVPGILIIVGIVLTIVAIILILTDKKKAPEAAATPSNPDVPTPVTTEPVAPVAEPTVSNTVESSPAPVQVTETVDTPANVTETPVAPEAPVADVTTPMESAKEEPLAAPSVSFDNTPSVSTPDLTAAPVDMNVAPMVNPSETVNEVPAMETPTETIVPEVVTPAADVIAPVSQGVEEPKIEEAPRPIYGGANPLENTATIPTVQAPYNGAPIMTPEIAMDVSNNVTPLEPVTPSVEPQVAAEPVVVSNPVVEEPLKVEEPVVVPEPVVETPVAPVAEQPSDAPASVTTPVTETQPTANDIETLEF